jgi:hypothetical protein
MREMIGFTAQRLMDVEVEALTGLPVVYAARTGSINVKATATGPGRSGWGQSNGAYRSCPVSVAYLMALVDYSSVVTTFLKGDWSDVLLDAT